MFINEFYAFEMLKNNCRFLFKYWGKAFFWAFWGFVTWYESGWKLALSITLMIVACCNVFWGIVLEPVDLKDAAKGESKV